MKRNKECEEAFVRSISSEPEDVELYRYALSRIKSLFLWGVLIFTVGRVSGNIKNTLVIILSIMPIRKFAGGMHLKSELGCYVASSILLLISVKVSSGNIIDTSIVFSFYIISLLSIFIFGSIGNNSRILTGNEKKMYGRMARFFCVIELLIVVALFYFDLDEYSRCICIGGIICAALQAIEVYRCVIMNTAH